MTPLRMVAKRSGRIVGTRLDGGHSREPSGAADWDGLRAPLARYAMLWLCALSLTGCSTDTDQSEPSPPDGSTGGFAGHGEGGASDGAAGSAGNGGSAGGTAGSGGAGGSAGFGAESGSGGSAGGFGGAAGSGGSAGAVSGYIEPVADVPTTCDTDNPEHFVIDSDADWSHVNDPDKRVFCVHPGDYRNAGQIALTRSGTDGARRILFLDDGGDTHPALLPSSARANVVLELSAHYWVIERMATVSPDGETYVMEFADGASHNVIDRHHAADFYNGFKFYDGAHYNTIQRSRVGPMNTSGLEADRVGIALTTAGYDGEIRITNNKILDNEIVDTNDGVQLVVGSTGSLDNIHYDGTIIDGNFIWITPDLYRNGGEDSVAENAIDLKRGSLDPANPIIISNNHMWGFRHDVDGSPGSVITVHYGVEHVLIEHNYLFDAHRGIAISSASSGTGTPYVANDVTIRYNVIHQANKSPSGADVYVNLIYDSNDMHFDDNVIVDSSGGYAMRLQGNSGDVTFDRNVIITSGTTSASGALSAHDNYHYDSSNEIGGNGDVSFPDASDAAMGDYTFTYDVLSGAPKQKTIHGVVTTTASPHH